MIKLIMCIGFLSVFGFVAYATILLLKRAFDKDQTQKQESKINTNQEKPQEENGNK